MTLPADGLLAVLLLETLAPTLAYKSDRGGYKSRAEKAMRLLLKHHPVWFKAYDGTWRVRSESRAGVWYVVDLDDATCHADTLDGTAAPGCEDSTLNDGAAICWHVIIAALAEAGRRLERQDELAEATALLYGPERGAA